uniref:USP8 dimerisation domain-containing protein n=1 Tax=Acrobeloides nanus TaxID=290746 RepID=A0A914CBJ6_9BILA
MMPVFMEMYDASENLKFILDPITRLCNLVDMARPQPLISNIPIPRYCHILHEMYEMANMYVNEQNFERALMLYLRFIGTLVNELPKHRNYENLPWNEKEAFNCQITHAMNATEFLKRKILAIYEEEAITMKNELAAQEKMGFEMTENCC